MITDPTQHPDLPGGHIVATPVFARLTAAAHLTAATGQAAVIHGPSGTGKTSAARAVLATLATPVHHVDLEPGMSSKDIVRRLHRSIVGHDDVSERDLQDDLVHALAQAPGVIVIRHAERLTREATGQLHWLHERPTARWPLFLIGGPGTGAILDREVHLRGLVLQTVEFKPLSSDDLIVVLRDVHPLVQFADSGLLRQIDAAVCHGNWRRWITFLRIAVHIQQQAIAAGNHVASLDADLARATIAHLPTTITKAKSA